MSKAWPIADAGLGAAAYMLEVLMGVMGQFLMQDHRRGGRFWRTFFKGDAAPGSGRDKQPGFDAPLMQSLTSALRGGVNLPWTLVVTTLLGIGLMLTRPLFGTEPPMAHSDHLAGAMIVTISVMALAEVGRLLRFINVPFGLWLVAAPWLLDGASLLASFASVAIGLAVVVLSLPRGKRGDEHYGNWDRFVL